MNVKTHRLKEILAKKLFGIEGDYPEKARKRMKQVAINAGAEYHDEIVEQKDTRIKELEGKLIRLQKITKIKQEFIDGYVRDKKELEGLLETAYRLGKTVARCDGVEEYNKLMIGDTLEEKIKNWKSNGRHDNR